MLIRCRLFEIEATRFSIFLRVGRREFFYSRAEGFVRG
jgi:hypothetical protein